MKKVVLSRIKVIKKQMLKVLNFVCNAKNNNSKMIRSF
jgi:hypothetical protein